MMSFQLEMIILFYQSMFLIKIKLKEFNMDILLQEEQPMLNQKPLWLITIN